MKNAMFILGVDFGLNGGIALLDIKGNILLKKVMPTHKDKDTQKNELDIKAMNRIVDECIAITKGSKILACGEKLRALYGVGSNSTFALGMIYGATRALLESRNIEVNLYMAKDWQKTMWDTYKIAEIKKKNSNKRDTKAMALKAIQKIYKGESFTRSKRAKIPHDGIVDAVLIAKYFLIKRD